VRRHVKASITQFGAGQPAAYIRRTGRPHAALLIAVLLSTLAVFAASASPGWAALSHPDTGVSFGPDGVGGSESFQQLEAVALDPSSGDVYAWDRGAEKIYKFDEAGNPVKFSGLSGNAIEDTLTGGQVSLAIAPPGSPGGTAGDIYVGGGSSITRVYAASGEKIGQFQLESACGVATDPSGNLYVSGDLFERHQTTVYRLTPTANPPTSADKSGANTISGDACSVAADDLGNVYLAVSGKGVLKLEGMEDATPTQVDPSATKISVAPGSNDLYADRENEVVQYDSTGTRLGSFGSGALSQSLGLAVNSDASKVYVGIPQKVKVFGPPVTVPDVTTEPASGITKHLATLSGTIGAAGGLEATCVFQYTPTQQYAEQGFEGASEAPCSPAGPFTSSSPTAVSASATGLSEGNEYRFRILGTNANGSIGGEALSFATPGAVNVHTAAATNLTISSATLNGTINPEGVSVEECRFEYGSDQSYGSSVPCAESSGTIGSGNSTVPVHANISGLNGAGKYHFRLVAKNELGTSEAEDIVFQTLGATIEEASLIGVEPTSAIFKAEINPNGEATSYLFEYVSEAEFEAGGFANATQLPVGGEFIGTGTTSVEAQQEATGLVPRTTYHVRAVATTPAGALTGPELVFSTFAPPSSGLPDGRAYEQASPVDKNGNDARGNFTEVRTSPNGDAISYVVSGGIPGAEGGQTLGLFLARRSSSGWSSQGLLPAAKYGRGGLALGLSEDLSVDYTVGGGLTLEKDTRTLQYTEVNDRGLQSYVATTSDDDEALFEDARALLPGATSEGPNLYLWDRTSRRMVLAGVLNNGETPTAGVNAGQWDWYSNGGTLTQFFNQQHHVISADGSRIFFSSLEDAQIYMRVNPTQPQSAMSGGECTEAAKACTYKVSESQRSEPDPNGPRVAKFITATADGSEVLFRSREELTDDANTGEEDESHDLYSYDTATHELTDLTPSNPAQNPNGAEVGGVLGASKDGSYVYFAAGGVLAPGVGSSGGACAETYNSGPGLCNIYRWHEGAAQPITYLTQMSSPDLSSADRVVENWAPGSGFGQWRYTSRVSPDGRVLVLSSQENLTSYDGHGNTELYRFEVGQSDPQCISCATSGEAPQGDASLSSIFVGNVDGTLREHYPRNITTDGARVFFETNGKLLAADTNGVQDVYEWEAKGTGTCTSEDQNGGCLYLITSGTSPRPSFYGDSSESGDDVYVFTGQPLVGQDRDELIDAYDARVGGGFAYQNPPPPSICTGESCRPATSLPPASQSPGTSTFSGPGNTQGRPQKHKKKRHRKSHKKKRHSHKSSAKRQQGSSR
jgi:hypothetical protein